MNKLETLKKNRELYVEVLFCGILFGALYIWARVQPLYDQPDEWCRFLLPYYISKTGKLPNGNLPSLMISTYGISYAYFPGLPYIFMGLFMKVASLFGSSSYYLLMVARSVNMIAGVVTFIFIRKLARLIFTDKFTGWFFSLVAILWPQVLFIFTYVNCDGFAYMSCAITMYGLARGIKNGWLKKDIIILAVGLAICLLSYFNAYGMVVGAFIAFVCSFISVKEQGKLAFDYKSCVLKGLMVAGLVLLLSGWWFIRSAILYDGDFLGLEANRRLAERYAIDAFKPSMKITIQSLGYPITYLLENQDYMFLVKQSFFGRFGNMVLPATNFVLRGYKLILVGGVMLTALCLMVYVARRLGAKGTKVASHSSKIYTLEGIPMAGLMICSLISAFIAAFLCVWYSYTSDYQPQGRYILPGLIPLLLVVFCGYGWLASGFKSLSMPKQNIKNVIGIGIVVAIVAYLALATISCIMTIYGAYYGDLELTRALVFNRTF